jgi:hypothetical protein
MESQEAFNAGFYEVVATVIPVVIVLLYVESGVFRSRGREPAERSVFAVTGMLLLVVAEGNALSALYERENLDGVRFSVVVFALIWGLGMVALWPLGTRLRPYASGAGGERFRRAFAFWSFVLGVICAVVVFGFGVDPFVLLSFVGYLGAGWFAITFFHFRQLREGGSCLSRTGPSGHSGME